MKSNSEKLLNWENFMWKIIKAKGRAKLHLFSMFWEMHQYIACNKKLAESTKSSILGVLLKNHRVEVSKESYVFISQTILAEAFIKAYKKIKKRQT